MHLRQFWCCERAQQENQIHRLGSALPSEVSNDHDRFEMTNGSCHSSKFLDVDLLRHAQRVFEFDPQITDCAIDLGMAKQKLDGPQVARFTLDFSYLRAAH